MEGLWRAVGCQRQGIWAIWFSGLSREGCFSLLVLWGNIENCIALGLGSVISYLFMLLGQGMCLLCPPVPLVPLPASLPTLAWPVGTIWGLAEDCQGCFVASTGFRSCIRLLTGEFYQAAFLFQGMFFHPPHFHSVCSTLCSLSVMKRRLSLWIGKFRLKYSSCFSLQLLRSLLNSVFLVALLIFPCPAATPAPLLCMTDLTLQKQTELIFDGF